MPYFKRLIQHFLIPLISVHLPQKAIVQPIVQQKSQDKPFSSGRRLPTLPQSPASDAPAFPIRHMGTLADELANQQPNQQVKNAPTSNSYVQMQARPVNEQIVHPLLMKHTNPPPAANLPPKGTIASQFGHTHDYQLVSF